MTGSGGMSRVVQPDMSAQPGFQSVGQLQAAPQPGAVGSMDDKIQQQSSQVQQQMQNQVNYGSYWAQQAQHVPSFTELTPLNTHLIPPVLAQAFQLPMPDWAAQGYAFAPQLMYGYMSQPQSNPFEMGKPQVQDGSSKIPQTSGQPQAPAQQQQMAAAGEQAQQDKSQQQMPRPQFQPAMFPYGNGFQPGAPVGFPAQLGMSPYHMMSGMMGAMPFDASFQQMPQAFLPGPQFSQQQPLYPGAGYLDYAQQSQRPKRPLPSGFANASGSDQGTDREVSTQAVKRQRLVWTKELHERFVRAVNRFGADKAMPKQILQMMNVEGLTRENIASHLQKYRIQLKKQENQGGDTCEVATTNDNGHFELLEGGDGRAQSLRHQGVSGRDNAVDSAAKTSTAPTGEQQTGGSNADHGSEKHCQAGVAQGAQATGAKTAANTNSKSTHDSTGGCHHDSQNGFHNASKYTGTCNGVAVAAPGVGHVRSTGLTHGTDGTTHTNGNGSSTEYHSVTLPKQAEGSAAPQSALTEGGGQEVQ